MYHTYIRRKDEMDMENVKEAACTKKDWNEPQLEILPVHLTAAGPSGFWVFEQTGENGFWKREFHLLDS